MMNPYPGKSFVLLSCCLAAAAFAGETPKVVMPDPRPNIVYILSDDHSVQTIGAYARRLSSFVVDHQITPNIDRLAREGAVFERSYCANSICSPSRASIITGLHSAQNGVLRLEQGINPGTWTFPEALHHVGYQTALIGKWHLKQMPAGFDHWRILPDQGSYWSPQFVDSTGVHTPVQDGYVADVITDLSLTWLEQRRSDKPFLLMCHHKSAHRPWMPPDRYYNFLREVQVPEPDSLFDTYVGREPAASARLRLSRDLVPVRDLRLPDEGRDPPGVPAMFLPAWHAAYDGDNAAFRAANLTGKELLKWRYQRYMHEYLATVKAMDDSIGRVLQYLDDAGLRQNTIVVYASDQGFFNGEHGWFDKRFIYEESLVMPLIIRWPGVTAPGTRVKALVQNIDHAPTIMDMAGSPTPPSVQGRSLVPWLRGEIPKDWRTAIYYVYADGGGVVPHHDGVRTERYTLAHFSATDTWELYDNERDPQQMHNVFADPDHAQVVNQLMPVYGDLRQQYGVRR